MHLRSIIFFFAALCGSLQFIGCMGIATLEENQARHNLRLIETAYLPDGKRPLLPKLTADSTLRDFLHFALLNHPRVAAVYFDWAASVERITIERSLPDPWLNFSINIQSVVTALMPGLMVDFPGPGKLSAKADVASAESRMRYFTFEKEVLQAAFNLKKAYYQLFSLEEKIRINRETLKLAHDIEGLARIQNEVGKVTMQDLLRAQIEQERLTTEIANLEDSQNLLLTQFKAALGLKAEDKMPPVPKNFELTTMDLNSEKLFAKAIERNPRLKMMEADVERAEAALRLAYKSRVPDFKVGLEADAMAMPILYTPEFGISLPIWRDKIKAEIAAAQSNKQAAENRLSVEQIGLVVELAEKRFAYHSSMRNIQLLHERLLPKARQSFEVARTSYEGNKIGFLDFIQAERMLLDFQIEEVDARIQRELALAEFSLLIVGTPPQGAPVLPLNLPAEKNSNPSNKKVSNPPDKQSSIAQKRRLK